MLSMINERNFKLILHGFIKKAFACYEANNWEWYIRTVLIYFNASAFQFLCLIIAFQIYFSLTFRIFFLFCGALLTAFMRSGLCSSSTIRASSLSGSWPRWTAYLETWQDKQWHHRRRCRRVRQVEANCWQPTRAATPAKISIEFHNFILK